MGLPACACVPCCFATCNYEVSTILLLLLILQQPNKRTVDGGRTERGLCGWLNVTSTAFQISQSKTTTKIYEKHKQKVKSKQNTTTKNTKIEE